MKTLKLEAVKSERLYMKVAEQLKALIETNVIKPGERLPSERHLAEQLAVSRPTIREAMIALEISNVIEIRSGSGIYALAANSIKDLHISDTGIGPFEILETRLILESEACALAAARITEEQLNALEQCLVDMQEEEKRVDASEKADQRFHEIIAEASQNAAIATLVRSLWKLRNESPLSTAFLERIRKEGIHPSITEHKTIFNALKNRDPITARDAMRRHIVSATENAAQYFSR